jgi:hypothetical protein
VQQALNYRKLPKDPQVDEIGIFGPATDAAVRRFQERNRLTPDGLVGPVTRAVLFPLAVVTVRAIGMQLRMPSFAIPRPGGATVAARLTGNPPSQPAPGPGPLTLPSLGPSFGFEPVAYPRLLQPLTSPLLAPPQVPGLTLPVHHLEIQPGSSVSLGRRIEIGFSLTLSGVVMIGPEKGRHQEFSSGVISSTPGVFEGGDWTVGWFAQLTHVEQLGRFSNFSWQPNAQAIVGHGTQPFLSVTASPAVVQFDATDSLSFSFGGPSVTTNAALDLKGSTISLGLGSVGVVGKF